MTENPVLTAIATRHSKRSFLQREVPLETIKHVLTIAGNAPSSKNTQPWQVAVVSGKTLTTLSDALVEKFDSAAVGKADYQYTLHPLPDEFLARSRAVGYQLFALKGIDKNDFEQRKQHQRENYLFFGAPLQLLFLLPKNAERGNFLDLGFFMQNVMLGLLSEGISSCPQASILEYSDTIRNVLGISDDFWIVSGLACGYADDNKINSFIPPRLNLDEYVSFYD